MEHVGLQRRSQNKDQDSQNRGSWLSVYAVGLATFSVVTTEMLPVGLMTAIADTYQVSVGTAGLTISIPAILAGIFAPIVVFGAGGIDRRRILLCLLMLLTLANLISAFAMNFSSLLAARVIIGFCMGGIWSVAGGLALRLVPERSSGLATAVIFGGVSVASVVGVPIGAIAGELIGWRMAFAGMAIFSLFVLIFVHYSLPALPAAHSIKLNQFAQQLGNRAVQLGLVITFLLVAGHFMAYTFVHPLMQTVSGFKAEWIGLLLFIYGAAGITGNFLAGLVVARQTGLVIIVIAAGLTASIAGFALIGGNQISGAIMLVLWGVAYGGVSVSLQTWMMKAAPLAIEVATSLFVAVFNIGIAFGSFAGGRVVDSSGLYTNLHIAAALTAIGLFIAMLVQVRANPKLLKN